MGIDAPFSLDDLENNLVIDINKPNNTSNAGNTNTMTNSANTAKAKAEYDKWNTEVNKLKETYNKGRSKIGELETQYKGKLEQLQYINTKLDETHIELVRVEEEIHGIKTTKINKIRAIEEENEYLQAMLDLKLDILKDIKAHDNKYIKYVRRREQELKSLLESNILIGIITGFSLAAVVAVFGVIAENFNITNTLIAFLTATVITTLVVMTVALPMYYLDSASDRKGLEAEYSDTITDSELEELKELDNSQRDWERPQRDWESDING